MQKIFMLQYLQQEFPGFNTSNLGFFSPGEFSSTNPSDWEVRLGEHSFLSIEDHEKHVRVVEIRVHPNYIPGNLTHPGDYDVGKQMLHDL